MRLWCWVVWLIGCGATAAPAERSETQAVARRMPSAEAESVEAEEEASDGMEIAGLTGSMDTDAIDMALRPQLETGFFDCFAAREPAVPTLGGHVRMRFRVDRNGRVLRVDLTESTVGDRETEVCVLAVARRTRFHPPRGRAEAEFAWGFEFDAPEDVPPPAPIARDDMAETLMMNMPSTAPCSPPRDGTTVRVTAYVQPGGVVLSAGAASEGKDSGAAIACLLPIVQTWIFPDPMNSLGKTSFDWP